MEDQNSERGCLATKIAGWVVMALVSWQLFSASPSRWNSMVLFAVSYCLNHFPWAKIRKFCGRAWGFLSQRGWESDFLFASNRSSCSQFKQNHHYWRAFPRTNRKIQLKGNTGQSTTVQDTAEKTFGDHAALTPEHEMAQFEALVVGANMSIAAILPWNGHQNDSPQSRFSALLPCWNLRCMCLIG